ncbi:MAG: cupin domain-containing protein [Gaiellales bacterium]
MGSPVIDLAQGGGNGPVWGTATEDLNATLLVWEPGRGVPDHVNAERDVLVVVLGGSVDVLLDGDRHAVGSMQAIVLPKGCSRRLTAGPEGVRYLTVHLVRPGLSVTRKR